MSEQPDKAIKLEKVEIIKANSRQLRGTLATSLADDSSGFDEAGRQLLKFHGLYEQDDRDQRKAARSNGTGERTHNFMLRTRLPGGHLTADQYLVHDDLATRYANNTLRITTRQCFQFHGLLKGDLKATLRTLNDTLVTSLGACGDVVRNVMCCPAPIDDPIRAQIEAVTRQISDHLLPSTRAYHEIWLDDEKVYDGEKEAADEPIYGKTYLPRKFKIAVAYPGDNCVDVYTQDIGLVAIADGAQLAGFNVVVGGGMGMNHSITIDVAYRFFATHKRKFIIADTPGHIQYTRNMVTGASTAQLAIVLVDVHKGLQTQSRRHGYLSSLLQIPNLLVAVNKMDLVDYAEEIYGAIVDEYCAFASKLPLQKLAFIPISALRGDNVVEKSPHMPWYAGPTLLEFLEEVDIGATLNSVDFRFPVQLALRPHQDFRGFAGQVASGAV